MDYCGEFAVVIERSMFPTRYKYQTPSSEYETKITNKDINALHNAIIDMAIIDSIYVKTVRYIKPNLGKRLKVKESWRRKDIEAYEWIMSDSFDEYSFRWLCSMTGRLYKKIRDMVNIPPRMMWEALPENMRLIKTSTYRIIKGCYKKVSQRYLKENGERPQMYLTDF